jgi:GH25 family lysozyme M1 (1,4-beta-N-acetylmuramidase)
MSKTGIDVSSYQGTVDWKKVKNSGIEFAILKIIRKDLSADKQFEINYKGCSENGVAVQGVYNYSYATTVEKAKSDANAVVKLLNGRKAMVWLDVEDNCQKNLKSVLINIINAYAKVIQGAGLEFGVYTGYSFYNSYIKPYGGISYPLWIARYGTNNGQKNDKYQPQIDGVIGWQYTSNGKVDGISGKVDMNVWYDEITTSDTDTTAVSNPYPEPTRLLYKKAVSMRGDDVKWVQYHLVRKGYMATTNGNEKSSIDGIFGKNTESAVKALQQKEKITVDGKVGVVTRGYLKQ